PFLQPLAGGRRIVLRQRRAAVGSPAQVPFLVHANRGRGGERQAEGGEERHLGRLAPERVGAGEERVETADVAEDVGVLEDFDLPVDAVLVQRLAQRLGHLGPPAGDQGETKKILFYFFGEAADDLLGEGDLRSRAADGENDQRRLEKFRQRTQFGL